MSISRNERRTAERAARKNVKADPAAPRVVPSIFDAIEEGNEFGSIVNLLPAPGHDLFPELQRALREIETIRGRPCICYAANVVKDGVQQTSINAADNLPFSEMVDRVHAATGATGVDVLIATGGGSGQQVTLFVDALRKRFPKSVEFLIPYKAMSAGTLWALSGDRIWMDERAFLGPIDPQVPGNDGRMVPAQSILTVIKKFQDEGQEAINGGRQPDWTQILLLKQIDGRQLGQAINSSAYSTNMAKEYLVRYKLGSWVTHSSTGAPVTATEREAVALSAANALCSHDRWKTHGHAITRDVINAELRLKVDRPEDVPGLEHALRKAWALLYYLFDKSQTIKVMVSQSYKYGRFDQLAQVQVQ